MEPVKEHRIADLIPVGRENAISRKLLTQMCLSCGLIDTNLKDSDRNMRSLVSKAREEHIILNLQNGNGYYKPSKEDLFDLQRYIAQEEKRAKATFKNLSMAKRLYEDYKHGRITEG